MRTHHRDPTLFAGAKGNAILDVVGELGTARRRAVSAEDAALLGPAEREQLARDIAEIERASAALRKAEPALETWRTPPAAIRKPHSVWLIVGTLWISTALVTLGAAVAISRLME